MLKKNFIISIIAFYIFWLVVLPSILSKTISFVCENISQNSAYTISIQKPKLVLSVLPVAYFRADNISVVAKNTSLASDIKDFSLDLRILPLLSGKFHVNKLGFGEFNLTSDLVKKVEINKDFVDKLLASSFQLDEINIKKFEAKLFQSEVKTPILYNGKDFIFERKNRYVKLKNNSKLTIAGEVTEVNANLFLPKNNDLNKTVFDVNFSNMELSRIGMYFNQYLPERLKEITGSITAYANKNELVTELNGCSVIMEDMADSIVFPEKMVIKSKFNINKHCINLEEVNIDSENIHASLSGRICDYFGKTMPSVDLSVRLNMSKVEDIISLLPSLKLEEINIYKLKKYKFYGDTLANLSIKGRLPEPELSGDVYIDNGIFIKPIPRAGKGATIKLNFEGKNVNFDVVVPAGDSEKVFVKGTQELYNIKNSNFTVKSTENVDLENAQTVVKPLHEVLNFVVGPLPIMDVNGIGNIDIIVKGNRKNPHIWGCLNFIDTKAFFNEMSGLLLTNTDAVLRFKDQAVSFISKTAKLNGVDISIEGDCDVSGKFDFKTTSVNQPLRPLYQAFATSEMFPEIKNSIPEIDNISGLIDFNLGLYGVILDFTDIELNKNLFVKGDINLKNNLFGIDNINIENANGKIFFDSNNAKADIKAQIGNLPLSLKGDFKNGVLEFLLDIPKLNPNFLISDLEVRKKQYLPYISLNSKYKGHFASGKDIESILKNIEYDKLNLKAKILESNPKSILKFNSGDILASNNNLELKNIRGFIRDKENIFHLNFDINDAFMKKPDINGVFRIKAPDICLINEILSIDLLPESISKYTDNIEFKKGSLDLNGRISSNKLSFNTDLNGISFEYSPLELPIEIINGSVATKNGNLFLNKINLLADSMPILLDGDVRNLFGKQSFNLYLNSKPKQEFIDKYINRNQIYPIKIKGDIVYSLKTKGNINNYDLKAQVDMSKDSSIYHFGATIGDVENSISATLDSKVVDKKIFKIKEFSYDKLVDSLSGRQTRLNLLKAGGGVQVLKDDLAFDNLYIKTSYPTDARIFNIIFRKPNIKQGQFTSDLKFNGKLSNPKLSGDFHIFETNIPFFDTSMKNIELVFKDKTIDINSKGDVLGNDITFKGVMKNKLTPPYKIEEAFLYTKDLNLNDLVNRMKASQVDNMQAYHTANLLDMSIITADNFNIKADNIKLRNIHATDFAGLFSVNENGVLDVKDFRFNIAQGVLQGRFNYNFNTDDIGINLIANSINANDLTWALFDLNNQVHGDMTGNVNLTCNGADFKTCMQTLNGETLFNVKNGRMPKLGSLEYLLKAGNLVKGGITGVSINNIIDIITPLKTGEFFDINGQIRIKDGIAKTFEITTKGKDLSLFIDGTYNFSTLNADMLVLGMLSKKISTFLGPIGNLSINTLFNVIPGVDLSKDNFLLEKINKIPAIELTNKDFRKFVAEIKGNINGEEYVKSFKWIN